MQSIYKYRLKLAKRNELRFISHLDWQNLILKIFRRLELKLVLSEGFNKMPKVSYSPALPIFIESDCELVDFQIYEELKDDFIKLFNQNSPDGLKLISCTVPDNNEPKSLEIFIQWAKYVYDLTNLKNNVYNLEKIRYIIEKCLSSDELLITKKTKKDIQKIINYRNSLKSIEFIDDNSLIFILKTGQNDAIPSLRADDFIKALFKVDNVFGIKRTRFFDIECREI